MKLKIPALLIKKMKTSSNHLKDRSRHFNDERPMEINAASLSPEEIKELVKISEAENVSGLVRKLNYFKNLIDNPHGAKVRDLPGLETALKEYINTSPRKWLFANSEDENILPYYVADVEYHPRYKDTPAYVEMDICCIVRGEKVSESVKWRRQDLKKLSVNELLHTKGYYLETPEAVKKYESEMEKYILYREMTGGQFLVSGAAFIEKTKEWYNDDKLFQMTRDGRPSKCVMDDVYNEKAEDEDEGVSVGYNRWWDGNDDELVCPNIWEVMPLQVRKTREKQDDDDDEIELDNDDKPIPISDVLPPAHPYTNLFDIDKHVFVTAHVNALEPYKYVDNLAEKLVLGKEKKDLISILVQSSSDQIEDIVEGKAAGTIVICSGPPGVGKTLTAEVFSETIKCPLYMVQCSQLGTDEQALEKRLKLSMSRAQRWKALLLLDEADVYIRERGDDIQQNAIVGVFLRVLEYYRGVIFMATNRVDQIDDAIMSRATAWLKYTVPTPSEIGPIWKILSAQYKIKLDDETIQKLTKEMPGLSGRNVRNILKLAHQFSAKTKKPVDRQMLRYVAKFLDLGGVEQKMEEEVLL